MDRPISFDEIRVRTLKLLAYCRSNEWAGYDPYDALNSSFLKILPLLDSRLPRIALTQSLKRSPINLRRVLLIPKTQNAKAMGLFLMSALKLSSAEIISDKDLVGSLTQRLIALRSRDSRYWCWGYSFPWQTRTIVVPRDTPNLVCTTFVANALLDAYEQTQNSQCLDIATSAANYIVDQLYWTDGDSVASFSYPLPSLRSRTHNASLLAAALLSRVYKHTGDERLLGPAFKATRYSVSKQQADGSWNYGESPSQRWIDNFHTGYNLCALQSIGRYAETGELEASMRHGLEFYLCHFFREDGAPRYFHNRTYPIDIHSVAQSIITLLAFKDTDPRCLPQAQSVLQWAMNHMWDARGFFYYRVLRSCTVRTSYMRWSQAWMLLALSTLICESNLSAAERRARHSVGLAN